MNVLYLLHILQTNTIKGLVDNIDLAPIDINLALWDAEKRGLIKIEDSKDPEDGGTITALKKHSAEGDVSLGKKLLAVIEHYAAQEINVTRGTLNGIIKDPTTGKGYAWHDYIMSLQFLIDTGKIEEFVISVPAVKDKRPAHKFVFLGLPGNDNEEWNAREVNKWIARFEEKKVK